MSVHGCFQSSPTVPRISFSLLPTARGQRCVFRGVVKILGKHLLGRIVSLHAIVRPYRIIYTCKSGYARDRFSPLDVERVFEYATLQVRPAARSSVTPSAMAGAMSSTHTPPDAN